MLQNMNEKTLESFLSENVKQVSQKVWRSNIKKIIVLKDENPKVEFLNDLIEIGKNDPRFSHLRDSTWHTIEKNTNSFLSWLNHQSPKVESPKVESPKVEEISTESSAKIQESLRQKQESLKIAQESIAQKQKEAEEESVRLQKVLEREQEIEAQKELERKKQLTAERLEKVFGGKFESEKIPERYVQFDTEEFKVKDCPTYFEQNVEFRKILALAKMGKHIIATGHAGTGKTEASIKLAHALDGYHFKIGATNNTKLQDLIGSKTINDEEQVKFEAGVVTKAVLTANQEDKFVILCIDEINCLSERIQKILNGLCDGTRFMDLPSGRLRINKGAKLVIFGTMNNGYSGTNSVNVELKDRFVFQKFENLSDKILHKIFEQYNPDSELEKKVIRLGKKIESYQKGLTSNRLGEDNRFTTRSMKAFFESYESYVTDKIPNPIQEALESVVVEKFDDEEDQKTVRNIIQEIGF